MPILNFIRGVSLVICAGRYPVLLLCLCYSCTLITCQEIHFDGLSKTDMFIEQLLPPLDVLYTSKYYNCGTPIWNNYFHCVLFYIQTAIKSRISQNCIVKMQIAYCAEHDMLNVSFSLQRNMGEKPPLINYEAVENILQHKTFLRWCRCERQKKKFSAFLKNDREKNYVVFQNSGFFLLPSCESVEKIRLKTYSAYSL